MARWEWWLPELVPLVMAEKLDEGDPWGELEGPSRLRHERRIRFMLGTPPRSELEEAADDDRTSPGGSGASSGGEAAPPGPAAVAGAPARRIVELELLRWYG